VHSRRRAACCRVLASREVIDVILLPQIPELELLGVADRGVPNRERVVLRSHGHVQMGGYALFLGIRSHAPGFALPVRDSMFWLGDGPVRPDDWVIVFTGSGTPSNTQMPDAPGKIYLLYWGRPTTIFHDPQVVTMLLRLGGVSVEVPPTPLPAPQ